MGKCNACEKEVCENKFENRDKCQDPSNCTCTCQESSSKTFWKGFGSVALGVAAFIGGTALTVLTAGAGFGVVATVAAVSGCGALTSVGATAAIHPISKKMSGERMTGVDYVKDLAIGGTIGAVTGPIGLGGASATTSIASNVGTEGIKQGIIKLGCRAAVGAVSGATSSVIQEGAEATSRAASGEKAFLNLKTSGLNILKGTLLGAATGGASHVSGNITNKIDPGMIRSVAKVAADTVSTVAIDASYQGIVDGKVDGKKLAFNATARAATSAGAEVVINATFKTQGGKDAMRDKLNDKKMTDELNGKDRESAMKAKEFLEQMPLEEVKKQQRMAEQVTDAKNSRAAELPKLPDKLGDQNVHALHSDHVGQFAADLPVDGVDGRGLKRVVYDVIETKEGPHRVKIAGVTMGNDYTKVPRYGELKAPKLIVPKPHLWPKRFLLPKKKDDDEDDNKNK